MKVCFRADASLEIGTGHVMRCLTLAQAIRQRGGDVRFVSRQHEGHLKDAIESHGFEVEMLTKPDGNNSGPYDNGHAAWRGVPQSRDAEETILAFRGTQQDWLVVDHYGLDKTWETQLRPHCRRLFVIDDLADRPHDCDLLLDQTLGRRAIDYDGLVPLACRVLTGPQFAPLRPEFALAREASLARRQSSRGISNILVSLGGVDKDNVTSHVLAELDECALPADCKVVVVTGATAPGLAQLQKQVSEMRVSTKLYVNSADMGTLMAEADLAIGAAGTTSWERCCMGLPTLLLVLADNQRFLATELERAGAGYVLADNMNLAERLFSIASGDTLLQMAIAAASITDGQGVNRIMDHLSAA